MDEFIREVDEEYRRDRVAQFWRRYNGIIVALAVLLVVGVGGWRFWEHRERTKAEAAAERYQAALVAARDGRSEEAAGVLESLAGEAEGGYRLLTRFRLAAELSSGDAARGAQAYESLAADASVPALWQDLARLRAAMLRLDTAEPAEVRPALERLATPTGAWRHSARELLGLSGLKAGDFDYAGRWFDQIAADRETPPNLRERLEIYSALVAGGPVQVTQ